jgi:voltage-gated potassium channel
MDDAGTNPRELKNTGYEIFIAVLSMLSIVNLVLVTLLHDKDLQNVLLVLNGLLSGVFVLDFAYRLWSAPSRSHYLVREYGWADLLASLPFPQVKVLRVFRLGRVYRLLREYGARNIGRSLLRHRAGSTLLSLLLVAVLVLEFGSLTVLYLEQDADGSNIHSASDALWYVLVTMSTVGYGDRFPVTNAGRIFGALVIVLGVGIFGALTGYLANLFLAPAAEEDEDATTGPAVAVPVPGDGSTDRIGDLDELLARQKAAVAELEAFLRRKD